MRGFPPGTTALDDEDRPGKEGAGHEAQQQEDEEQDAILAAPASASIDELVAAAVVPQRDARQPLQVPPCILVSADNGPQGGPHASSSASVATAGGPAVCARCSHLALCPQAMHEGGGAAAGRRLLYSLQLQIVQEPAPV